LIEKYIELSKVCGLLLQDVLDEGASTESYRLGRGMRSIRDTIISIGGCWVFMLVRLLTGY